MVKPIKLYSGRSGTDAVDMGHGRFYSAGSKSALIGEKTTVRSGPASKKTYITTKPISRGQTYVAKRNSSSTKKKK